MTEPPHLSEVLLYAAKLTPHRSLTQRGFAILMGVYAGVSLIVSLPFYLVGAWPIVGFMGLDVLLLFLALRASFRSARAYEQLALSSLELMFARVSARGARREWRFNPLWVKLERIEHEEFGTQRLDLISRGRGVEVGKFLGPDQKAQLAADLSRALAEARRGPRFSD
jgi:uncharacterized membrane protein